MPNKNKSDKKKNPEIKGQNRPTQSDNLIDQPTKHQKEPYRRDSRHSSGSSTRR